jgi:hypothetical protein
VTEGQQSKVLIQGEEEIMEIPNNKFQIANKFQ